MNSVSVGGPLPVGGSLPAQFHLPIRSQLPIGDHPPSYPWKGCKNASNMSNCEGGSRVQDLVLSGDDFAVGGIPLEEVDYR